MTVEETVVAELVHVGAPQSLVAGSTPAETVERHVEIADELKRIIQTQGLSVQVQGKAHVKVEGWQALGLLCSITAVVTETEVIDGGFMATVEARRTTDGMVVGRAQAICTNDEKRGPWKSADRYALLSMAQTRATSKALKQAVGPLMALAGYQTTPAEEMPTEPVRDAVPVRDRVAEFRALCVSRKLSSEQVIEALSRVAPGDVPSTAQARRGWISKTVDGLDDLAYKRLVAEIAA